ncbi:hypothetical protein Xen7305DRAFT_00043500 [Xenococcus sp. PCC 7305]|uniref:PIN domain-containing protein n=1 Tax=Xenococcus sp. PCC 7305 TaxID=102125 RepID=UPI0002ABC6F8|nr:PIN domain-containing protein [Xenococcus sp. PCC 7305]ELS04615.1 hypothetical protein Xen7305DRAFT_00043500 [Xenococcus sp. PCC 7305]
MGSPRTAIYLDTEALFHDRLLKGLSFESLRFRIADSEHIQLCVSKVVLLELVNQRCKQIEKKLATAQKACETLSREFGTSTCTLLVNESDVEKMVLDYRKELFFRISEEFEAKIVDFPIGGHERIVARAVEKIPPFDAKGRGYQDTLIWLGAVDLIEKNEFERVIFVSNNTQDFEPALRELQDDVYKDKYSQVTRIEIVKSIDEVVKKLFQPIEETASKLGFMVERYVAEHQKDLESLAIEYLNEQDPQYEAPLFRITHFGKPAKAFLTESYQGKDGYTYLKLSVHYNEAGIELLEFDDKFDYFNCQCARVYLKVVIKVDSKGKVVGNSEVSVSNIATYGEYTHSYRERNDI